MKEVSLKSLNNRSVYYCGYDHLGIKISHREDLKMFIHLNLALFVEKEPNGYELLNISKDQYLTFQQTCRWQFNKQPIERINRLWVNCIKAFIILHLMLIYNKIDIEEITYKEDCFIIKYNNLDLTIKAKDFINMEYLISEKLN